MLTALCEHCISVGIGSSEYHWIAMPVITAACCSVKLDIILELLWVSIGQAGEMELCTFLIICFYF